MSLLELPRPVQLAGDRRTHRLGDDAEGERIDRATAAPQPPAEETAMPRGKRNTETSPMSPTPATEKPPGKRRGRKPGFKRKPKADKVVARLASTSSSEPNFVVDDAGRIAIIDGTVRIDLSMAATKRLVQFMDRTKSFRS